jgi:hypothetical protein
VEGFGIADAVHPHMKTKQVPDDFRDWIEARTFEIGVQIALPPRLPLNYLKRANPQEVLLLAKISLEADTLGDAKCRNSHRSICLPYFPAVSHVRRYSLRA